MNRADHIFQFICDYSADNRGLAPSYRQIAQAVGCALGSVNRAVLALEADGRIRRVPGCWRTIEVVVPPKARGKLIGHSLRLSDFPLDAALKAIAGPHAAPVRETT